MRKAVVCAAVGFAWLASAGLVVLQWPAGEPVWRVPGMPPRLQAEYRELSGQVEAVERQYGTAVVRELTLREALSQVQLAAMRRQYASARQEVRLVAEQLGQLKTGTVAGAATVAGTVVLPILMYHETPADFEGQLDYLRQAGYTTIDPQTAAAGLAGVMALPAKPVVITLDDGYASQWRAFQALQARGMKATFYIIPGGADSRWCIGAGRRYGDPLQPAEGCGDEYLTWQQVGEIDRSGLMTIGAHTVNHLDLVTAAPEQRAWELRESKRQLELVLGHPVNDLAYPYGSFNDDVVAAARAAGFVTAVTTMPGTEQERPQPLRLRRVRDAYSLP